MADSDLKQVAALCWRRKAPATEVLLITSRETGRWVIPKGWPMAGLEDHAAAGREAFEEAGVAGDVNSDAMGQFSYDKLAGAGSKRILVTIYALEVGKLYAVWPEKKERQRQWFLAADAAQRVAEPGLKAILRNFRP